MHYETVAYLNKYIYICIYNFCFIFTYPNKHPNPNKIYYNLYYFSNDNLLLASVMSLKVL